MGKYISRNLGIGEEVRLQAKVHWACLIWPIIFSFGIIIIVGIPALVKNIVRPISFSFGIIGIPALIKNIIRMCTTELGFTNKNFLGKTGLVNTKVMNSPLNKVNNVSVQSGLWGKIFGYGTVYVNTASGSYEYACIKNADNFRTNLLQAIEAYETERVKQQAKEMANAMKGMDNS